MFRGWRWTAYSVCMFILLTPPTLATANTWRPCPELSAALRFPCRCKVEPFGPKLQLGAVAMDCDYVVFHADGPSLPTSAPIISYSQRYSGQQTLPNQVRYVYAVCIVWGNEHWNRTIMCKRNVTSNWIFVCVFWSICRERDRDGCQLNCSSVNVHF